MRDTGASPIRCVWRVRPWRPALVRIGGLSAPSCWRRGTGETRHAHPHAPPLADPGCVRAGRPGPRTACSSPPWLRCAGGASNAVPCGGCEAGGHGSRETPGDMRATRRTRRQAPANIPRGEYSEARAKASGRSQGMEDDPGRDGNPGAREGSPQGMETIPGAGRQRRAEVVRGICEVTSADDHTAEGQRRRGAEA